MSTPTTQSAEAGRRGEDVRSDCWVRIALTQSGGIELALKSKVESMYGDSIRALVADELTALGVRNAKVEIEDFGALPFVIMARVECAARRLGVDVGDGYVPGLLPGRSMGLSVSVFGARGCTYRATSRSSCLMPACTGRTA